MQVGANSAASLPLGLVSARAAPASAAIAYDYKQNSFYRIEAPTSPHSPAGVGPIAPAALDSAASPSPPRSPARRPPHHPGDLTADYKEVSRLRHSQCPAPRRMSASCQCRLTARRGLRVQEEAASSDDEATSETPSAYLGGLREVTRASARKQVHLTSQEALTDDHCAPSRPTEQATEDSSEHMPLSTSLRPPSPQAQLAARDVNMEEMLGRDVRDIVPTLGAAAYDTSKARKDARAAGVKGQRGAAMGATGADEEQSQVRNSTASAARRHRHDDGPLAQPPTGFGRAAWSICRCASTTSTAPT